VNIVFGGIWFVFGLMIFIRPQLLRWWTGRKAAGKVKWPLLFIILWIGFDMGRWIMHFDSLRIKVIGCILLLVGIQLALKVIFSASSEPKFSSKTE